MRRKLHPRASAVLGSGSVRGVGMAPPKLSEGQAVDSVGYSYDWKQIFGTSRKPTIYVDVSQRKYTCKPSGKFSEFDPDFIIHFEWFH